MAAWVQDVATFTTVAGVKTATITPALGALLVVFSANSGTIVAPAITDDRGGTYDLVRTSVRSGSLSGGWCHIRSPLVTIAAAHVITFTPGGTDTGGGLDVLEVSDMQRYGGNAARTAGNRDNWAGGMQPTCVMDRAALTANPVLAFLHAADNVPSATLPAGYTNRQSLGYNVPAAGMRVETRDSGETTATITWGGTETSGSATLAVELDITQFPDPGGPAHLPFIPQGRAI